MDLFKNIIQPTIVHLGNYEQNTALSNKYFLNYNVVQIDWFANNSIVMEDGSGVLILEDADDQNPLGGASFELNDLMEDNVLDGEGVLDLPRIYFSINDKFIDEDGNIKTPDVINSFILTLMQLSDNCIECDNSDDTTSYITEFVLKGDTFNGVSLIPGQDFFINETFAKYLINIDLGVEYPDLIDESSELYQTIQYIYSITLPNYLDVLSNIQLPWVKLTQSEENNTDIETYLIANELSDFSSQYDVNNFYSTFCEIILNESNIVIYANDFENLKYKMVLEYFKNFKSDSASIGIQLILGTQYNPTTQINTNINNSYCNCRTTDNNANISSCYSLYNDAMLMHLVEMLGNPDFYNSWFYDNGQVNKDLIKNLSMLIKTLIDKGNDLSFNVSSKYNTCNCQNNIDSEENNKNYDILKKYLSVLNWVEYCKIGFNINKIKLYGSQFGELLPKLQF